MTVQEKLSKAYAEATHCDSCEYAFDSAEHAKSTPEFYNAYYGNDYSIICETCEERRQEGWA